MSRILPVRATPGSWPAPTSVSFNATRPARTLLCAGLLALLSSACSPSATEPATSASPQTLPTGNHEVIGRVVTVCLPYRSADGMLWVAAQHSADIKPFVFRNLDVEPHAGPQGTDLAVFVYEADGPGSATLEFGLVPAGKALVGPPGASYLHEGPPAARYTAAVTVQ